MKRIVGMLAAAIALTACQKNDVVSEYTGNQVTYALQAGSQYPISGTAVIKERKDGAVSIQVQLTGTSDGTTSPVHLHMGNIAAPQADVAALLSPVTGKTGLSETIITRLADETPVTYASLVKLNACIKVHLSDVGAERNIILAAGNIGSASSESVAGGRLGVAVCKSN